MQLLDKLIILLYCFGVLLLEPLTYEFVAVFLLALIVSSCIYLFANTKFPFIITTLYGLALLPLGSLFLFLPLIAYDILVYRNNWALIISALCLVAHVIVDPSHRLWYALIGFLICFVLQYKSSKLTDLNRKFYSLRDDSTENSLLLHQKNAALIEAQNYEIQNARLKERHRIAREIHDNVGHLLSRSILITGALKTISKEENVKESILQLEETLSSAMDNVRTSVHDLHDESVDLKESMENLAADFLPATCTLDYDVTHQPPREVIYCFIAITQEALNNISKHSNANQVSLILREHSNFYQLSIHDNGENYNLGIGTSDNHDNYGAAATSMVHASGMGLENMKERVRNLGGIINFNWNNGFQIFISIPKTGA